MVYLANALKETPKPSEYPTVGDNLSLSKVLNIFKGKKPSDLVASLSTEKLNIELSLQGRLNSPDKIDQGQTSLCGPAAFFYSLATKRQELYARYVVDMALYGKAYISLGTHVTQRGGVIQKNLLAKP